MSRITIIGAGFAALSAARKLRALGSRAEITMIAPKAEFVFLPSTIWIPSRLREPEQLQVPLQPFLDHNQIVYHKGVATGLREGGRVVETDSGDVKNDGLIIACGGRFIKKAPGIEHTLTPCEGIPPAVQLRDRLEQMKSGSIAVRAP